MTMEMIGRRYQILSLLGTGGMGSVYRAFDRLTGQTVALKRVATLPMDADGSVATQLNWRIALAQEFKMLASLRHPHIIGVLDYGFQENRPYYTMELLEDALTIIEAGQGQPLTFQINLLVQLLQALLYLHRRGILHRDLKPSNVLVANDQVKVLDFGLSIRRENSSAEMDNTVGTLAYMAPEILTGGVTTESVDLYATGVMAYEMIAGHHPFNVDNLAELVDSILTKILDTTQIGTNPDLAHVLDRLLAKDPLLRYSDSAQVIAALNHSIHQPVPMETVATRESFLVASQLVGRDTELSELSNAFHASGQGRGSAWLIGGESGVGKSRLLDEIRVLALVQGADVVRGQAISEGGSPYQLWRTLARWFAVMTDLDDKDLTTLTAVLPELGAILGRELSPWSSRDVADTQSRLVSVFDNALRSAEREVPLVLILEDLQWAGPDSLAVLSRLSVLVDDLPLLILASYRDDERPDLPSQLAQMRHMVLERLSEEGIAQLSAAMLGPVGQNVVVVDLLQRETEGNVFFLIEVVRALAEAAGQLDLIGEKTLPENVFAGGVRQIVQQRLNRVPPESRGLLRVAAIAGRELDLNLLRTFMPQPSDLDEWLVLCADAAVLAVQDDTWRFAHDKLREGVLADLLPVQRSAIHHDVAQAIEGLYHASAAAALAYHWGKAGDEAKEMHYATLAGEDALHTGAYNEAIPHLERALALAITALDQPASDLDDKRAMVAYLRGRLAETYLGIGRYKDAQALYHENLELGQTSNDSRVIASAYNSLGEIDYALAEFENAEQLYRQSLGLFRTLDDRHSIARVLNNLGNVAYELGDDALARQYYQESLAITREIGEGWGMAGSVAQQGHSED